MFRRILIYALGAVFLTAGGVRAQQPEVVDQVREARRVADRAARAHKDRRRLPLKHVRERQVAVVRPRPDVRAPRRALRHQVRHRQRAAVRVLHALGRALAP